MGLLNDYKKTEEVLPKFNLFTKSEIKELHDKLDNVPEKVLAWISGSAFFNTFFSLSSVLGYEYLAEYKPGKERDCVLLYGCVVGKSKDGRNKANHDYHAAVFDDLSQSVSGVIDLQMMENECTFKVCIPSVVIKESE